MKSKIFSFIATLVLASGLCSCHDDINTGGGKKQTNGQVNLRSMGVDVNNAETIITTSAGAKSAARANVDLSDFNVTISSGGTAVHSWRYADMPELFTLPVGDYTVKVVSHQVQKAEWEHPLFIGEKTFSITENEITPIGIVTCYLSNIKVSVRYDSRLRELMGDDVKVTVIANDEGKLEYTPDETRAGYFEAIEGSSTLVAELTGTIKGNFETYRKTLTDVKAGQHRIITFVVKEPYPDVEENGGIEIGDGLYLDMEVENVNLNYGLDIREDNLEDDRPTFGGNEGGGEQGGGDDPEPKPEDFIRITSDDVSFDAMNSVDGSSYVVKIHSDNGIEHFVVKIESTDENFIKSVGELMPTTFDLAYIDDPELAAKFTNPQIGFPVNEQVIGAKDLNFDISGLVPLLGAFPGTHKFTLAVTDKKNLQVTKSISFKVNKKQA